MLTSGLSLPGNSLIKEHCRPLQSASIRIEFCLRGTAALSLAGLDLKLSYWREFWEPSQADLEKPETG